MRDLIVMIFLFCSLFLNIQAGNAPRGLYGLLIEEGVWEFNERMGMDGRNLCMVWNRAKVVGGGESYLTIEECEMEDADGRRGNKKMD